MKSSICRVLFGVLVLTSVISYGHQIQGVITSEDNLILEGIGVYNKTNGGFTYSDISGHFELDGVELGDFVVFYGLGYNMHELRVSPLNLNKELHIVLKESAVSLDQVVLVGNADILSKLLTIDVETNPVKSSQEILRKIPGLFIGQHAGGGKAEQIFLRGFDIDHGTDIAISVDGMPVNMVSHAHGQGYADMHFIIPETIETLDFGKGPYYPEKGNFNTAGYVSVSTLEKLEENLVKLEVGDFNTLRSVGLFNLLEKGNNSAYFASEFLVTDGVFTSPQNFNRLNLMTRYQFNDRTNQKLGIGLSHFQSRWDASGQIPVRAVKQNIIGRFGAIDDTEGGQTSRSNIWLEFDRKLKDDSGFHLNAYVSKYDFELFSNFTFFLEDPENGDQIKQKEQRLLFGAAGRFQKKIHLEDHNKQLDYNLGGGFRFDDVDEVQLSNTLNRKTLLDRQAYGDVDELNTFGFASARLKIGKWTFNPGIRIDYFNFGYQDFLAETYSNKNEHKLFFGPKVNMTYSVSPGFSLLARLGYGFHSNDTRVVVVNNGKSVLPGAFGTDFGAVVKPLDGLVINLTLWSIFLQQEFVYVGDAAIVEPSGKTKRLGVDFGVRYQPTNWLYLNGDINYAYARFSEAPAGEDYIPLAPDLSSTGGISVNMWKDFFGGLNYRYLSSRSANEDNSLVADGYFIADFNMNYRLGNWTIGMVVENLFDSEWNETQFATESRLRNEPTSVEEIHFTPGTPFFLKGLISVSF